MQKHFIHKQELKLTDRLGKGSFGWVYNALWKNTNVAVKLLQSTNDTLVSEFELIRETIFDLHHPNIIHLFGVCSIDEIYHIIMEPCPSNLKELKQKLNFSTKKNIVNDICNGVLYLQSKRLIHQRLYPSNILLTSSHQAKIADVFIARKHTLLNDNFKFLAPEILLKQSICLKTDIWSVGLLIYFLFFGEPYQRVSIYEFISMMPKSQLPLKVPKHPLKNSILACCIMQPQNRIDITELQKDITHTEVSTFCVCS